jgi:hypothetical protein
MSSQMLNVPQGVGVSILLWFGYVSSTGYVSLAGGATEG